MNLSQIHHIVQKYTDFYLKYQSTIKIRCIFSCSKSFSRIDLRNLGLKISIFGEPLLTSFRYTFEKSWCFVTWNPYISRILSDIEQFYKNLHKLCKWIKNKVKCFISLIFNNHPKGSAKTSIFLCKSTSLITIIINQSN